jgi:flagellar transcriptional activator FlhC
MNRANPVLNSTGAVLSELKPEYRAASRRYVDQHWAMLCWSRLALSLGARMSVVEKVTGIDRSELIRIFTEPKEHRKSCGNSPKSIGWFIRANLLVTIQTAHFYAIFSQLRDAGILPAEALIKAYEKYFQNFEHDVRLSFDRAFQLVSLVDGYWTKGTPLLQKSVCNRCGALYLVERRGESSVKDCPLCELSSRYARSVRLSRTVPSPSLVAMFRLSA